MLTFSTCAYGCDPAWALSAPDRLCPDCLGRLGQGLPIAYEQRQAVVELPLNATLDDVVGGASARLPRWKSPATRAALMRSMNC